MCAYGSLIGLHVCYERNDNGTVFSAWTLEHPEVRVEAETTGAAYQALRDRIEDADAQEA